MPIDLSTIGAIDGHVHTEMLCHDREDPLKGKLGARKARDLIENYGDKDFKFPGIMQDIHPAGRVAYSIYEVIAQDHLPAFFYAGYSGMATGMRRDGGLALV